MPTQRAPQRRSAPASRTALPRPGSAATPGPDLSTDSDVVVERDKPVRSDDAKTASFTLWPLADVRALANEVASVRVELGRSPCGVTGKDVLLEFVAPVPEPVKSHFAQLQRLESEIMSIADRPIWNVLARAMCDVLLCVAAEVEAWWSAQMAAGPRTRAEPAGAAAPRATQLDLESSEPDSDRDEAVDLHN